MFSGAEIGVILLVIALIVVLPRLRRGAVALVDEQSLGREELHRIREQEGVSACESAPVAAVMDRFEERLRLRIPALRTMVVERAGLNAVALPDGTVLLWRGLVDAVDAGEIPQPELAGLLAHEIAHIELGHGRQRAASELMAGPLMGRLALLAGGPLARFALGKGTELLRKGASRQAELEADALAAQLLVQAGFPQAGLSDFLGRLGRLAPGQPRWADLLSTHPHIRDRRARLQDPAVGGAPRMGPR